MISNPITTTPDATVAEVDALCGQFRISGLPVVEGDGKLVGIITNRDMRFVSSFEAATTLVRDVMTKAPLITAPVGIDPDDAIAIFAQHQIEKLPLVDDDGRLAGLITVKDFDKSEKYPLATKDDAGPPARRRRDRLLRRRLGARRARCATPGVDVLVVDTANGDSAGVLDIIRRLKADPAFAAHRRHRRQRRDPLGRAGADRCGGRRGQGRRRSRARSAPPASSPASACRR